MGGFLIKRIEPFFEGKEEIKQIIISKSNDSELQKVIAKEDATKKDANIEAEITEILHQLQRNIRQLS